MTRRHLYVIALWLPLLLVVFVSVGETFLEKFWWHEMSSATGYFLLSGMMGGIQYLLFAAAITWRFAGMDEDFLTRISWVMPIMFFPLCIVGLWVFFQLADLSARHDPVYNLEHPKQDLLPFCLKLGMYCVGGCYAYVAAMHLLARTLWRYGILKDE
ncbi:MAG: hypothetical protein K2Q01_01555 [Rickettsiales bacterium]|nr:hypothetical protein [Rickettsiales bacterium]